MNTEDNDNQRIDRLPFISDRAGQRIYWEIRGHVRVKEEAVCDKYKHLFLGNIGEIEAPTDLWIPEEGDFHIKDIRNEHWGWIFFGSEIELLD